jgi:hypothetical protein
MLLNLAISLVDLRILLGDKSHERLFRLVIILHLTGFIFNDSWLLVKV